MFSEVCDARVVGTVEVIGGWVGPVVQVGDDGYPLEGVFAGADDGVAAVVFTDQSRGEVEAPRADALGLVCPGDDVMVVVECGE